MLDSVLGIHYYFGKMYFVIPKGNVVEVYDSATRQRRYNIHLSGTIIGTPSIQGTQMIVYVQEGSGTRTHAYDLVGGQRKYTI